MTRRTVTGNLEQNPDRLEDDSGTSMLSKFQNKETWTPDPLIQRVAFCFTHSFFNSTQLQMAKKKQYFSPTSAISEGLTNYYVFRISTQYIARGNQINWSDLKWNEISFSEETYKGCRWIRLYWQGKEKGRMQCRIISFFISWYMFYWTYRCRYQKSKQK